MNLMPQIFGRPGRPVSKVFARTLTAILLVALAGCVAVPTGNDIVAATAGEVQEQAWKNVQELTAELGQLDTRKHPGLAGLVADLREAASRVDAGLGGSYDQLDVAKLIRENPNYWQALMEMEPGDTTLAVLEGMVLAASGNIEGARDALEIARAGPLMDDSLDGRVQRQLRTIDAWSITPPGLEIFQTRGAEPAQRWEPLKRLQAMYPDSAVAAMEVLRMRADLAGIDLAAEGEDERMRDKILAAEPQAMEVIEAKQPLWAAILKANGEAGDAARRIAEMLKADETGMLNFSVEDWAQLVADFDRVGLPDWAIRALRMRAAENGSMSASDLAALRQLLPRVMPEATANRLLDQLEAGTLKPLALRAAVADPAGSEAWPTAPVVSATSELMRRRAAVVLADSEGELDSLEEQGALITTAASSRHLGDLETAERAINELARTGRNEVEVESQRLSLAMARGDLDAVVAARAAVLRLDRQLKKTHFTVANSYIATGDWAEASEAFAAGFKNRSASTRFRAFSALHAHGAATLAGSDQNKLMREALALVEEDEWIARLLQTALGEVDRAQILIEADEGRDHVTIGKRCEAHFALAFAPGQTAAGRRAEMEACRDSGMGSFIEYEFATMWLRRN